MDTTPALPSVGDIAPRAAVPLSPPAVTPLRVPLPDGRRPRKPHRFRPGTVSLRYIRREQSSAKTLIRRRTFLRFLRHIGPVDIRYSAGSVEMLRAHIEDRITRLLQQTNDLSIAFGYKSATARAMRALLTLTPQ